MPGIVPTVIYYMRLNILWKKGKRRLDGWMVKRVGRRTDRWMDEQTDEWMKRLNNGRKDEWNNEKKDE